MVKLFTHTDLDGIGCAVLAKLAFSELADVEYCNYDDINEKVNSFLALNLCCDCHITDISITKETAEKLNTSNLRCNLLDHHETALYLNNYDWCSVQVLNPDSGIKTSGTELYYNWLVDTGYLTKTLALDNFVELIRNYDTWLWSNMGEAGIICKQVNDLLYIYGRDKFITWCISEIHDEVFPRLYSADLLVLEAKQTEINNYVKEKDQQLINYVLCDRPCGVVFAEKYISELGNSLCALHPELDFIVIVNINGTVSYRSIKDNIHLGTDIAKAFGGGGHAKAAGSKMPSDFKLSLIDKLFG